MLALFLTLFHSEKLSSHTRARARARERVSERANEPSGVAMSERVLPERVASFARVCRRRCVYTYVRPSAYMSTRMCVGVYVRLRMCERRKNNGTELASNR